jgi:hypothetical protein
MGRYILPMPWGDGIHKVTTLLLLRSRNVYEDILMKRLTRKTRLIKQARHAGRVNHARIRHAARAKFLRAKAALAEERVAERAIAMMPEVLAD